MIDLYLRYELLAEGVHIGQIPLEWLNDERQGALAALVRRWGISDADGEVYHNVSGQFFVSKAGKGGFEIIYGDDF